MLVAVKSPRKLIEVALPLDDINVASAREKSIWHGHPSTLHLWWARRPLAAARALVDVHSGVGEARQRQQRGRAERSSVSIAIWDNGGSGVI